MCGIFAIFAPVGKRLPEDVAARVADANLSIRHRGPDAHGVYIDPSMLWAVGHVRLAVVDVGAESNQPFWSTCGRYCVVFNGEIYNYLELRSELEREGVRFRTRSDTEVLLHAIIHWGPTCIGRLNGMWSFVFCDRESGQFIVCRDRWGAKPLYMTVHDGMLAVCSEAKGLFAFTGTVPPPDLRTIGQFVKYSVGGECETTWFEGVRRFPKRSYWQFGLRGFDPMSPTYQTYWDYPTRRTITSASEAVDRLTATLQESVRIRLRSDMPVGLSLSGGLDSATIAWIAGRVLDRPLETYTAWHAPMERSELPMAQRVATAFGHRSTPVAESSESDVLSELTLCVRHLDSGHSSPAIVPYMRLCRAARRSLTVMLEGQGADELLAGYTAFQLFSGIDRLLGGHPIDAARCFASYASTDGCLQTVGDLVRFCSPSAYESQALRWGAGEILADEMLSATPTRLRNIKLNRNNLDSALRFWHEDGLANLLQYGDAISMSFNLETRCPFLDYRLVELGFSLHESLLVGGGLGKVLLREAAKGHLPEELVWNRHKRGFSNSTAAKLRQMVDRQGLPAKELQIARQLGLLRPALTSEFAAKRLPDNVLFRLMNVLVWARLYYGD